jgi:hypothetical protein
MGVVKVSLEFVFDGTVLKVEGGTDRVVRNGSKDGLAASVAFRSMTCPFLYMTNVMLSPAILFWPT